MNLLEWAYSNHKANADNCIRNTYGKNPDAVYTDAATNHHGISSAVVVDARGKLLDFLMNRKQTSQEAETTAILLAVRWGEYNNKNLIIITDSTRAIRNLICGLIPIDTRNILPAEPKGQHRILWSPAHEGLEGNERADSLARQINSRRETDHSYTLPPFMSLNERLYTQRQARKTMPAPHHMLDAEDARNIRKLQTNVFPHKSRLSLMFPERYNEECHKCKLRADLFHTVWNCPIIWQQNTYQTSRESWDLALSSSDLSTQRELLERAKLGAFATGVLEIGLHP